MSKKRKPWTRTQKLMLLGVIVALFVGIFSKITIEIKYLKNKINTLEANSATIDDLKTESAKIKNLITETIESKNISTGECPDGYGTTMRMSNTDGLKVECVKY